MATYLQHNSVYCKAQFLWSLSLEIPIRSRVSLLFIIWIIVKIYLFNKWLRNNRVNMSGTAIQSLTKLFLDPIHICVCSLRRDWSVLLWRSHGVHWFVHLLDFPLFRHILVSQLKKTIIHFKSLKSNNLQTKIEKFKVSKNEIFKYDQIFFCYSIISWNFYLTTRMLTIYPLLFIMYLVNVDFVHNFILYI